MQGFGTSPIELMACEAMLRGEVYLTGFTYSATFVTGTATALAANASAESDMQINADSDFVVQEANMQAFTAADTPETVPDYLVNIVLTGSGRQIMNQAQHVCNYFGAYSGANSLQNFERLPYPILLTANTTVAVTLTNRSAAAANRVDCMFRGFKVFYISGRNRQQLFHVL